MAEAGGLDSEPQTFAPEAKVGRISPSNRP